MVKEKLLHYLGSFLAFLVGMIGYSFADCYDDCLTNCQQQCSSQYNNCIISNPQESSQCMRTLTRCSDACGDSCPDCDDEDNSENGNEEASCPGGCCGIKLNTNFPIIGNCIETKSEATNPTNAFPTMLRALTKIIMSVILVVCFILVIVSGILWSMNKTKEAKGLIKRVAITILLLGFSGVILKLVNPNFFY